MGVLGTWGCLVSWMRSQGVSVDRKGQGEKRWVQSARDYTGLLGGGRYGLCGRDEDVDQWPKGLSLMEAHRTLMRLSLLERGRQGREGGGESRHPLLSTDYLQSYGLGPGGPSEINQAWSRDVTKWTIASPLEVPHSPNTGHSAMQGVYTAGIVPCKKCI